VIGKVTVEVSVNDAQTGVEKVEFYVNNKLEYTDYVLPQSYSWSECSFGKTYNFKVKAYDYSGNSATDDVTLRVFSFCK